MSLAADGGGGGTPSADAIGWAVGGVAAAAMGAAQLVASYGAQSVRMELETLVTFKKRAEELLQALSSSPAAASQLSQLQLNQGNLGEGFAESADLMTAYNRTFNGLQELVKGLAVQIEGMTSALAQTAANYGATEEEQANTINTVARQAESYTGVSVPNVSAAAPSRPSAPAAPSTAAPATSAGGGAGAGGY
ncbi:hypothetical protein [Kitasatospora indigofera]|uniref:hypothetical protein n=1 Tax=Kitasatospora indigofera TaxID=67307 RepID=UPI00167CE794|nr:hypothetical protein [Kitasatospora indigofera]